MLHFKLIAILAVILYVIYRKLNKIYNFWWKKGIKGPKPLWVVGNVLPMLRKNETLDSLTRTICETYPDEKVLGIYFGVAPTLILKDLTLVRNVLIKDFACFADRGLRPTQENAFESIFFQKGVKWKVYRKKMHPLFSTGRMKKCFPSVVKHIDEFLNYIEKSNDQPKELRTLDHKFSVKLMMSSLFGLPVDTFNEEVGDDEIMEYDIVKVNLWLLGLLLYTINPYLPSAVGLKFIREKFLETIINRSKQAKKDDSHRNETIFDFMVSLKKQIFVQKEEREGTVEVEISDAAIAGNVTFIYTAVFEAFANSSHLLFELAQNQAIQERCYREIAQVMNKYNGDLTFEAMGELQYVNMAFDESLRMYPAGGSLLRVATTDYHFEDIDLTIEKGTGVIIPTTAIHYDPKYFPDPEVFDPERFSPENKKKMQACSYLPFGDGPRKCPGFRLATFQSILLVARLLHKFKVTPCEKTVSKIQLLSGKISLHTSDGLWVNITKRQ